MFGDQLNELTKRGQLLDILLLGVVHLLSPPLVKRRLDYILSSFISGEVVRNINGCDMILSLKDKGISRELILYRRRETKMTDFLRSQILREGDVVLDIGANIGYYVLLESKIIGEKGTVYAIEPVSATFRTLLRNLKMNTCRNVEPYHLAVGGKNGKITINVSNESNKSAVRPVSGRGYDKTELVNMLTVDSFLEGKKPPDLIRMDVEGYEYEIVKGMAETLKGDTDLFIEVHGFNMTKEQMNEFYDILVKNEYDVKFSVDDFLHNINKFANLVVDRTSVWNTPVVLEFDIEQQRQWTLQGKGARVLFSKEG